MHLPSLVNRSSPNTTFVVLTAGAAAFAMLQSLVTPMLSTIQTELQTSQNMVTWIMTANLLSAAIFTPILGRFGDARGKKQALVIVLVALAAGSLLAAVAPNIGVLIVARVIQGAAGAVFPLSYGIIRDSFPPPRVASAVASISAVIAAGGGLGIVLAGPIVAMLGYPWLFWIPMIVADLSALAARLFVPESPVRHPGRINWLAAGLLSAWLVALLLAVSMAADWGWTSLRVIGLLGSAAVTLGVWLGAELRSANPLIDMRIMRLPAVWTTNLVALLIGAGQFAMFAFLPQFMQTPPAAGYGFGASITEAGLLLLPMLAAMFFAGIVSGRIEQRFSSKAQLATSAMLSVLAFNALALGQGERWQVVMAAGVFGVGLGLALSSLANLIVSSVPVEQTGVASGMNANVRTIGGAIGAAAMGSIVTSNLQPGGLPYEAGYSTGFLLLARVSVAAVAAALAVPSSRQRSTEGVAAEHAKAPPETTPHTRLDPLFAAVQHHPS